jgi:hypothetical protein
MTDEEVLKAKERVLNLVYMLHIEGHHYDLVLNAIEAEMLFLNKEPVPDLRD